MGKGDSNRYKTAIDIHSAFMETSNLSFYPLVSQSSALEPLDPPCWVEQAFSEEEERE